jgi:nicotinamidase-related amidase
MQYGLILIDIQNDYFEGGRHPLVQPNEAAANALLVLSAFRAKGWPIFHVQHISTKPSATFFLPNTPGAEFYADTAPVGGEPVILKHKPNSFLGTDLAERLTQYNVDQLVVCGMMTHMCVDTTVRAAADLGYSVTLISDACATRDLLWAGETVPAGQVQRAYLAALDGSFARVVSANDWLKGMEA